MPQPFHRHCELERSNPAVVRSPVGREHEISGRGQWVSFPVSHPWRGWIASLTLAFDGRGVDCDRSPDCPVSKTRISPTMRGLSNIQKFLRLSKSAEESRRGHAERRPPSLLREGHRRFLDGMSEAMTSHRALVRKSPTRPSSRRSSTPPGGAAACPRCATHSPLSARTAAASAAILRNYRVAHVDGEGAGHDERALQMELRVDLRATIISRGGCRMLEEKAILRRPSRTLNFLVK